MTKMNWDDIPNDERELDVESREFVDWKNGYNVLYMEKDDPREGINKFGRKAYYFDVKSEEGIPLVWSVTSTKLMIKLKKMKPLKGKVIGARRSGAGKETEWDVKEE